MCARRFKMMLRSQHILIRSIHKVARGFIYYKRHNFLTHYWRRSTFIIRSFVYDIDLKLGRSPSFNHKTICQGSGNIIIHDNVSFGFWLGGAPDSPILIQPRDATSTIEIGKGTVIMQGCEFIARQRITIGEKCRIGPRSIIYDTDFHDTHPDKRDQSGKIIPVSIGNNVWFGTHVIVLKGVTIGQDAVIGAGCVVHKDVPDGSIVIGNPMQIVGSVYTAHE
jgi:acetyltransferase-like isoleucine patch superfamily enzyme